MLTTVLIAISLCNQVPPNRLVSPPIRKPSVVMLPPYIPRYGPNYVRPYYPMRYFPPTKDAQQKQRYFRTREYYRQKNLEKKENSK